MKKVYVLIITIFLGFILAGCSQNNNTETLNGTIDSDQEAVNAEGSDILVAYFSITGNTQRIAEFISADTNANLFEIEAKEPYSEADVNSNDQSSRSYLESQDSTSRPEINGSVEDFDKFSTIFIGYPIWYGKAPAIINTFLESYNFSGRTIVPFCTSGSSPIAESEISLKESAADANWLEGKRFSSDSTEADVTEWINSLNLGDE